jgi:hypothetical protein
VLLLSLCSTAGYILGWIRFRRPAFNGASMKPSFALNLTHEGIGLLHRGRGGWLRVGEVALDEPDMAERMAWLRRTAAELATGGVTTKLILPNSEILYDEVPAPGQGDSDREAQVRRGLEGHTPYSIDELAYDYVVSGGVARVAVVARETLAEAEAFASEHRFNPVSFVAMPPSDAPPDWFSGEPLFGLTSVASSLLDDDDPVERENAPVRIVGQANLMGIGHSNPVVEVSDSTPVSDVTTMQAMEAAAAVRARQEAEAAAQAEAKPREKTEAEARKQAEAEVREKAKTEAAADEDATHAAEANDMQDEASEPTVDLPTPPPPPSLFATRRGRSRQIEPADPTPPEQVARRLEERNTRISSFIGDEEKPTAPDLVEPDLAEPTFEGDAAAEPSRPAAPALSVDGSHQSRLDAATVRVTPDPRDAYVPMVDDLEPIGLDAARTLFVDAPNTRGRLPIGLMVTCGLLVVLLLAAAVGAYLTMDSREDTADATPPIPAVTTAVLEPPPEVTAPDPTPETGAVPEPAAESELVAEPKALAVEAALPQSNTTQEEIVSDGDTAAVDPPIPEPKPAVPTLLNAEATYAETGIWMRSPEAPGLADIVADDGIFLSALDPEIQAGDAVALPENQIEQNLRPITPLPPVAPGQVFEFDDNGLVLVPIEGAITPDGVQVRRGRPPLVPPERPASAGAAEAAAEEAAEAEAEEALALFRPRGRPKNANEILERRRFGGYTLAELETKKPRQRPESEQALAAAEALADTDSDAPESSLAITSSRSPLLRPGNIAQIVAAARAAAPQPTQAVAAVARATPRIPTTASVARQATLTNAISLRRVNLIGVFGSPSNRRALVRLSSGRIIRVGVGDRVDGGRVAAIGTETLQYVKSGRNITLGLPEDS